jgi:serine/threonine-protein kinase
MSRARSGITRAIADNALPKRYTSASLIARGGMGEVYRATDSILERKVAVKMLSERHSREEEVRARFRREALAAARLSGTPHVITVFDVGEHKDQPYIVMEYLDGGSVHDRLRNGTPVPPGLALEWLAQAGIALDRAHAEGIVHRDVKPANLLLDRDGKVVVTDFGIASTTGMDTLTLPGTVLGTVGYLSPEQARGEPATDASDRYALGVVAFELLTGRRPFASETAATEALAHVNAPVPSAETMHPELPDGVDEVLQRALAKDPADRPATCADLVAELRAAFTGAAAKTRVAPPPVVATGPPTRPMPSIGGPPSRSRSNRTLAIGAVTLLVLGAILAGLLVAALDDDSSRQARSDRRTTTTQETQPPTTTQETTQETTTTETTETTDTQTTDTEPSTSISEAEALNDQGYERMQAGDFAGAQPLLEQALGTLQGTGRLSEAYTSYNVAYTRFALGSCDGVLALLERSEAIQGERSEITRLYREASATCGGGGGGDDD